MAPEGMPSFWSEDLIIIVGVSICSERGPKAGATPQKSSEDLAYRHPVLISKQSQDSGHGANVKSCRLSSMHVGNGLRQGPTIRAYVEVVIEKLFYTIKYQTTKASLQK